MLSLVMICSWLISELIIYLLQDLSEKTTQIFILLTIIFILLLVFIACQFPSLLRNEFFSTGLSLLVVALLGFAVIYLNESSAPLPLFSLILAVHTMLPVDRWVCIGMAIILTVCSLVFSYFLRGTHDLYLQVSTFR